MEQNLKQPILTTLNQSKKSFLLGAVTCLVLLGKINLAYAALPYACQLFTLGIPSNFDNSLVSVNFSGLGAKNVYSKLVRNLTGGTYYEHTAIATFTNNGTNNALVGVGFKDTVIKDYVNVAPGQSKSLRFDMTLAKRNQAGTTDVVYVVEGTHSDIAWSNHQCGDLKDFPAVTTSEEVIKQVTRVVTAAVSRSQTSVIQQNVGSRVSTVVSAPKNSNVGTPAENAKGNTSANSLTMGQTLARGFANDAQTALVGYLQESDQSDQSANFLQKLAMEASFDTSLVGMGVDAGKTDAEGDGVEARSALPNASALTVWGHGSYTSLDNDFNQDGDDNRYNGDVWGYNIGLDYRFQDNLIAGLSLGYNDSSLTTSFNNGTYEEDAWILSPYAIYSPLENLHVVMEGGYGLGDIDVSRNNNAVTGVTESDLWYGSVKASYAYTPTNNMPLTLRPSASFLVSQKNVDAYTESDGTSVEAVRSNTRQLKSSLEASYDVTVRDVLLSPFVEGGLVHDFTDAINGDKTAVELGGGVRLFDAARGLNAALEGTYLAGRSDYTQYTVSGTVSYGFDLPNLMGMKQVQLSPYMGSNLNELGNQAFTSGLNVNVGSLESSLSVSHNTSEVAEASSSVNFKLETKF